MLYYFIYAIIVLLLGVWLTVAVAKDCKYRDTNSPVLWVILTAVIGIVGAVTYAVFVPKLPGEELKKHRKKNTIIMMSVLLAAVVVIAPIMKFVVYPQLEAYEEVQDDSVNSHMLTYTNENGEEIIYDKMGKTYTVEQWGDFLYYDRDGNSYSFGRDEDDYDITFYKNTESGERFYNSIFTPKGDDITYDCVFDSDGYICFFNDDDYLSTYSYCYVNHSYICKVYFDNNENLYYTLDSFDYDDSGNIVFHKSHSALKDFKYSDIPSDDLDSLVGTE